MDNYESVNAQLIENQIKLALLETTVDKILNRVNLFALIFLTFNLLILGIAIHSTNNLDNYSCSYQHSINKQD